jgi:hypothetical protein
MLSSMELWPEHGKQVIRHANMVMTAPQQESRGKRCVLVTHEIKMAMEAHLAPHLCHIWVWAGTTLLQMGQLSHHAVATAWCRQQCSQCRTPTEGPQRTSAYTNIVARPRAICTRIGSTSSPAIRPQPARWHLGRGYSLLHWANRPCAVISPQHPSASVSNLARA